MYSSDIVPQNKFSPMFAPLLYQQRITVFVAVGRLVLFRSISTGTQLRQKKSLNKPQTNITYETPKILDKILKLGKMTVK
jgi:hypothetical protein